MALRKIVTLPEPVLRRKAHTVDKFDKNLQTLIDDMVETMREAPGVGLAAPQVGLAERLIVVEYYEREEDEEVENAPKKVWAIVNPEIIDHLNGILFTDRATRVWQPPQEVEPEQEV
jgi:peptide deformylase